MKKTEDCPRNAMYIFATNKEVHKHSTENVQALHTDIITTDAEDYRKDPKTGGMKRLKPVTGKMGDLLATIQVAVGVSVIVTRNPAVEDGIVNGCFGKIANSHQTKRWNLHSTNIRTSTRQYKHVRNITKRYEVKKTSLFTLRDLKRI